MKNIKLYELEETYHGEKFSFEYPTVSYTKDTDKVWYMKNNQVKMMFSITEDIVNGNNGEDLMVWENSVLFDSVKVDGVEYFQPIQDKDTYTTPTLNDDGTIVFTEDSYVPTTLMGNGGARITLNTPLPLGIEDENGHKYELLYVDEDGRIRNLYYNIEETTDEGYVKIVQPTWNITPQMGVFIGKGDGNMYGWGETIEAIGVKISYQYGGPMPLFLPTTEVRDYEVTASIYRELTNLSNAFAYCYVLTSIDLSNFDTSNVTDMSYMFKDCWNLTSIDLSNFDTTNVTDISHMFEYCERLTLITFGSQANIRNIEYFTHMFDGIDTTGMLYYPSTYNDIWDFVLVQRQSTSSFPATWTAIAVD